MTTESRRFTHGQRKELEGYVALSTAVLRVVLYFVVVGLAAWLLRLVHLLVGRAVPLFSYDVWWIAPIVLFAILVMRISKKGSGGGEFRAKVRCDLAGDVAAVHRVSAVDAIEIEEEEDEGIGYFVLTKDGGAWLC